MNLIVLNFSLWLVGLVTVIAMTVGLPVVD